MAQWQEVYHFEGDQQAYFIILNANFVVIITAAQFFHHSKKAAQRRYNDNEICVKSYKIDLLALIRISKPDIFLVLSLKFLIIVSIRTRQRA